MARLILPFQSVYDLNGHPLPGAKMFFYESGTVDLKDTYSDEALTTPNTNPVIADSQGQFGDIFLSGAYNVKLTDADDVTQPDYPAEIAALLDTSAAVLLTGDQTIADEKTFTGKTANKADTPIYELEENDAPANNRIWQFVAIAEQFIFRLANDARDSFTSIFTIDRTDNTADTINFLTTNFRHNGADIPTADSATTFSNKTFSDAIIADGGIQTDGSNTLKTKIIDIGDWDMDATANVNIAHGLTYANIRSVQTIVRDDADLIKSVLTSGLIDTAAEVQGYSDQITPTNVKLNRKTGGFYDNVSYDSTSYNRGWITITYIA
ncbi:hypothetical protein KAR91_28610 [Candidatus Pacearchaeota archaeon]|nr:hypothetical protein [Candidatus Pacearchaeota archaeon]